MFQERQARVAAEKKAAEDIEALRQEIEAIKNKPVRT